MGNLIQRNRGKRGAPDVTRNLSSGKVTTTYRDPRKKGSLGMRVTKSHDSNGNVHVTESFNYGGGVTKKTRIKQNKSSLFSGARTTSGRTRKSSANIQLPADVQLALLLIIGGMAIIGFVLYYLVIYWYLSIPAALLLWYGYSKDKE